MTEISCTPFHDNCPKLILEKLIRALKYTSKVYLLTHGAPILLFKFKELKNKPIQVIKNYLSIVIKSMGFLCGYILTCRIFHCYVYGKLLGRINCKKSILII